ncbi:hypothetical protein SEPCBS119000_002468 [Sporothrix epigloea]|uniref:Up-regulated during septation protein 1 domain-containing protein n=1 Tax=Sporothrix epigloea TaxID=1892477 RepID=A0ABP0DGC4_9PEZI
MEHLVSSALDVDHDLDLGLKLDDTKIKQQPQPTHSLDDGDDTKNDKEKSSSRPHPRADRKYQLFPKPKQQRQLIIGKGHDQDQDSAVAVNGDAASKDNDSGNNASKTATSTTTSNATSTATSTAKRNNLLRIRFMENPLIRRRKISVTESGPLSAVQDAASKSPNTSGRPAFHERSVSAPGHSLHHHHQHHLVGCQSPSCDDIPEHAVYVPNDRQLGSPMGTPHSNSAESIVSLPHTNRRSPAQESTTDSYTPPLPPRRPMSPRNLAPLVIPSQAVPRAPPLPCSLPASPSPHVRAGNVPFEPTTRSAPPENASRTHTPVTPFSPLSAETSESTLATPVSATPIVCETDINPSAASQSPISPDLCADSKFDTEAGKLTLATTVSSIDNVEDHYKPLACAESTVSQITLAMPSIATGESVAPERAPATADAGLPLISSAAEAQVHRRGQSEFSSFVERAWLRRKRSASRKALASATINSKLAGDVSTTQSPAQPASASTAVAADLASPVSSTTVSQDSKDSESHAVDPVLRGCKPAQATALLGAGETAALAAEALQKASGFNILSKEDVDSLSRELQNLDERAAYLRRVCTSLRADSRNMHVQICQYLRSFGFANTSHDALLYQQEILAELDISIDYRLTQLEQVEYRRACVHQKLLEHIAAAATLPLTCPRTAAAMAAADLLAIPPSLLASTTNTSPPSSSQQPLSTPPRSPPKTFSQPAVSLPPTPAAPLAQHSQRPVVAQIPLTIIEQPIVEEAEADVNNYMAMRGPTNGLGRTLAPIPVTPTTQTAPANYSDTLLTSPTSTLASPDSRRVDVESIRIYVGDDVYALLNDVENQITQLGSPAMAPAPADPNLPAQDYFSLPRNEALSREERRRLHRAHSQDLLTGFAGYARSTPAPLPPSSRPHPAAIAPAAACVTVPESSAESDEIFLTSAVFRPERSILAT